MFPLGGNCSGSGDALHRCPHGWYGTGMRVVHLLLLLFIAVPLAEIYLLLQVGGVIGAVPTIGLVVATAAVGAVLVRVQGFSTILEVRRSLDAGEIPAVAIIEGILLLVAGALLLTPGFVTDAVGFGCLVPPLRRTLILRFIETRVVRAHHSAEPAPHRGRVFEGEFRRED